MNMEKTIDLKNPQKMIEIYTYEGRSQAKKERIEVNTDEEKLKVSAYLMKTWDGFSQEEATKFVDIVWDEATQLVSAYTEGYAFTESVEKLQKLLEDSALWLHEGFQSSEIKATTLNLRDKLYRLPMAILISSSELSNGFRDIWDYEKAVNLLSNQVKADLPTANKWRPKGWSKMAKNYKEYEGIKELSSEDLCKEFGGFYSGGAACGPFPVRISLPHVMYDDKEQGNKPLQVLIGSLLAQVMEITAHNNDVRTLKALDELEEHLRTTPDYWKGKVTNFDYTPSTQDKFVRNFWHLIANHLEHKQNSNSNLVQDILKNMGMRQTRKIKP